MTDTTTSALDGLLYLRDGSETARWNFPYAVDSSMDAPAGIGRAVQLSYGFLASNPDSDPVDAFLPFDADQRQAVRQVLARIAEVARITFVESGTSGQITFAQSAQPATQGAYAYAPAYGYTYDDSGVILSVQVSEQSGHVWVNHAADWTASDWRAGAEGYATLLHEVGHALGLKHPFEGSSGHLLDPSLDDARHTLMSYDSAPGMQLVEVQGTEQNYSWTWHALEPSTLMPLDIEALQYLYGANRTTRTGNDSYRWDTDAELLETIWDGGGVDLIDCSNQRLACVIDLNAGHYSSIGWRQTDAEIRSGLGLPDWFDEPLPEGVYDGIDNLAIASGSVIENATGGSGNDRITGNSVANLLKGGAGADRLAGLAGNDTLDGGAGNDTLDGGVGVDMLSYAYGSLAGSGGVTVSLASTRAQATGGSGSDTVSGFENLTGSARADRLTGSSGANLIQGLGGDDVIAGGSGNDTLVGGVGRDSLSGGLGNDVFDFNALSEFGLGSGTRDMIVDFTAGDRIDLSTLDAKTGYGANDAFVFKATAPATNAGNGVLWYSGGLLYGSTDADSAAEWSIQVNLSGISPLNATSYLVL